MADGQELDNLLIKVDSELGDLKGINSAISSLKVLSDFTADATGNIKQLKSLGGALQSFNDLKLSGLNEGVKGINDMVSALKRLTTITGDATKSIGQLGRLGKTLNDNFNGIGKNLQGIDAVSLGVLNLVNALDRLTRISGSSNGASRQLKTLGESLQSFNSVNLKGVAENIADPLEKIMKAIGDLGNNNTISIKIDPKGVNNVNKTSKTVSQAMHKTKKELSSFSDFLSTLENDKKSIDLGSMFDITQPTEDLRRNLGRAVRMLGKYEEQARTSLEKVNSAKANFKMSDLENNVSFRNAFRQNEMAKEMVSALNQGIDAMKSEIEGRGIQEVSDAWKHLEESISNDIKAFNLGELTKTTIPLDQMKANLRTLKNELSKAETEIRRSMENMKRLVSSTTNPKSLQGDTGFRQSFYKWRTNTEYVKKYQEAIKSLDATVKKTELLPQNNIQQLKELPHLKEQLKRYQEYYKSLEKRDNLTDEQQRQMEVFKDGITVIQDKINAINDNLEGFLETEEGTVEYMRQLADESDRVAKNMEKATNEMQGKIGNGFGAFGSTLSGSGNQILGSLGNLSSTFGKLVSSGTLKLSEGSMASLTKLAGVLGTVSSVLAGVGAVLGVVIAVFKTWYSLMEKAENMLKKFNQSCIQFAKNMLSTVVKAFNSVAGAVSKAVSIMRSGAQAIIVALRKMADMGEKVLSIFARFGSLASLFGKGAKAIASLITPRVVKNLVKASSSLKDIVKQSKLLSSALKTVNKWITMLTRMLMRKIVQQFISGLKQAFDDLVVYEKNASDEMLRFNTNVSMIFSGIRRGANQWVAAFEPLINALTPMIVGFLDGVQSMGEAFAKFMAILTGQPYYIRAKRFYEDYGQNVEDTAKKVKNLTNGLDELNILNETKDSDTGINPEDMFEKVPVDGSFEGFKLEIKDILDKIVDFLKGIDWAEITEKARDFVSKLMGIINEILRNKEFWAELGRTVAEIINFLFGIINQAVHDLDWVALGQAITTFLKNALENIDWELIRDTVGTLATGIATTLNEIFADKELWKDIGSTVAHIINDVIVEYLDKFAWTFDFSNFADSIALAIKTALEDIEWDKIRHAVDGWTQGIVDVINTWANDEKLWEDIGDTISSAINNIFINAFNDLGDIDFVQLTESLKTAITNALKINWDEFEEGVDKWVTNIADTINGFLTDEEFLTNITTSITKFSNIILGGLSDLLEKIEGYDIGKAIGDALVTGLSEFDWDTAFILPAEALNELSQAIRGLLDAIPEDFNLGTWLTDHLILSMDTIDWELIEQNMSDLGDEIAKTIDGILQNEEFWTKAGQTTGKVIQIGIDFFFRLVSFNGEDLGTAITNYVNGLISQVNIGDTISKTVNVFLNLVTAIDVSLKGIHWDEIGNQIAQGIVDAVEKVFNNRKLIRQTIEDAFHVFNSLIYTIVTKMNANNSFYKIGQIIGEIGLGLITGISEFFEMNGEELVKAMKGFADGLANFITDNEAEIVDKLNTIIDGLVALIDTFFNEKGKLYQALRRVIKRIDLAKLIGSLLANALKVLISGLKNKQAIWDSIIEHFPSLLKELGGVIVDNLGFIIQKLVNFDFATALTSLATVNPFLTLPVLLLKFIWGLIKKAFGLDNSKVSDKDKGFLDGWFKDKVIDPLTEWWEGDHFWDKWFGDKKKEVEVPIEVTPVIDENEAEGWDDLFDDTKKVPIELEDPKLGTITASLIDTETIEANILNVVDIFADRLHVGDIDSDMESVLGARREHENEKYWADNVQPVETGTISTDGNEINADKITTPLLNSDVIKTPLFNADLVESLKATISLIESLQASIGNITSSSLNTSSINASLLNAGTINGSANISLNGANWSGYGKQIADAVTNYVKIPSYTSGTTGGGYTGIIGSGSSTSKTVYYTGTGGGGYSRKVGLPSAQDYLNGFIGSTSSNRARATSNNASTVWKSLYDLIGNPYGVAGLMGNLYAESGLNSSNLQDSYNKKYGMTDQEYVDWANSHNDFKGGGFGLAQWTSDDRLQNLLDFTDGGDISDLNTQLEFLKKELEEYYPQVLEDLRNATSVLDASNSVLKNFEKPKDQSASTQQLRKGYGEDFLEQFLEGIKDSPAILGARREDEDLSENLRLDCPLPSDYEKALAKVDWNKVFKKLDWNKLLKNIDWNKLLQNFDLNKLFENLDLNELFKKLDLDKLLEQVDWKEIGNILGEAIKDALGEEGAETIVKELPKYYGENNPLGTEGGTLTKDKEEETDLDFDFPDDFLSEEDVNTIYLRTREIWLNVLQLLSDVEQLLTDWNFADLFLSKYKVQTILDRLDYIKKKIEDFLDDIKQDIEDFCNSVKELFERLIDEFLTGLDKKAEKELQSAFDTIREYVKLMQTEFESLKGAFSGMFDGISDEIRKSLESALNYLKYYLECMKEEIEDFNLDLNIFDNMSELVNQEMADVYQTIDEWLERIDLLLNAFDGVVHIRFTYDDLDLNGIINDKLGTVNIRCDVNCHGDCSCCNNGSNRTNNTSETTATVTTPNNYADNNNNADGGVIGKKGGIDPIGRTSGGSTGGVSKGSTGGSTGGTRRTDDDGVTYRDDIESIHLKNPDGTIARIYAVVDGQMIALSEGLGENLKKEIAEGKYPLVDKGGNPLSQSQTNTVLNYLKQRGWDKIDGKINNSDRTHDVALTPNYDTNSQVADGGVVENVKSNTTTTPSTKESTPKNTTPKNTTPSTDDMLEKGLDLGKVAETSDTGSTSSDSSTEKKEKKEKKGIGKTVSDVKTGKTTTYDADGNVIGTYDINTKEGTGVYENKKDTATATKGGSLKGDNSLSDDKYSGYAGKSTDVKTGKINYYDKDGNIVHTEQADGSWGGKYYANGKEYASKKEYEKSSENDAFNKAKKYQQAIQSAYSSASPKSDEGEQFYQDSYALYTKMMSVSKNAKKTAERDDLANKLISSAESFGIKIDEDNPLKYNYENVKKFKKDTNTSATATATSSGATKGATTGATTTATGSSTSTNGAFSSGGTSSGATTGTATNSDRIKLNSSGIDGLIEAIEKGAGIKVQAYTPQNSKGKRTDLSIISREGNVASDVSKNAEKIKSGRADEDYNGYCITSLGTDPRIDIFGKADVRKGFEAWYQRFQAKGYQMGGMPNSGELFVARENGTPEFVGSFGNQTAVANNDQIVTAVANGVSMANDSLRSAIEQQTQQLENAIDRKDLNVQIGDRQIAEANRRGEQEMGQSFIK